MQKIKIVRGVMIQGKFMAPKTELKVDDRDAHMLVKMGKAESLEKDGVKPIKDKDIRYEKPEVTKAAPKEEDEKDEK